MRVFRFVGHPTLCAFVAQVLCIRDLHDVELLELVIVLHDADAANTLNNATLTDRLAIRQRLATIGRTLKTSTRMKSSGLSKETVWPSGTHFANSGMSLSRVSVLWLRMRSSILYYANVSVYNQYSRVADVR